MMAPAIELTVDAFKGKTGELIVRGSEGLVESRVSLPVWRNSGEGEVASVERLQVRRSHCSLCFWQSGTN